MFGFNIDKQSKSIRRQHEKRAAGTNTPNTEPSV